VSEPYIRRKIKELNLRTIPEITNAIKAGACMHVVPSRTRRASGFTRRNLACDGPETVRGPGERERIHKEEATGDLALSIQQEGRKTVNDYIRPMLRKDGGDLEIIDIKDKLILLTSSLRGAARGCEGANQTLK